MEGPVDLRTAVRILREHWLMIVAITGLTTLVTGVMTWQQTPVYTARTTLFVAATNNDSASAYQGNLLAQQRAKSYAQLLRGENVMRGVATQLNLKLSATQLSSMTSAEVLPETVLLAVTVSDSSAARTQQIANAVADQFISMIPELENTPTGKQPPVRVTVVNRATRPSAPVSPHPRRNLGIGLAIGLAIGVGLAGTRHVLDATVKTPAQLVELTEVPSLGSVPLDANAARTPLVINDDPYGMRAEAFKKIRTNLRFVDLDHTCKVVLVTSAVAGEGKSTTACNLAIAAAEAGKRVLIIDADLRRPQAAHYLGLPTGVGLTSVLIGSATLAVATQPWGDLLSVLASGPLPPNPSELLGSAHMRALLDHLRNEYDLVVVDGPPVLPVADATATATACDGTIVVVRYGKTKREQVHDMMNALLTVDAQILGTVLNLVPERGGQYYSRQYAPHGAHAGQPAQAQASQLVAASSGGTAR